MLDLYLILVPAVLLVILAGLWIIRGMSQRAKFYGRLLITVISASVAGLIAVAFLTSVTGMIALAAISGYLLYKRRLK